MFLSLPFCVEGAVLAIRRMYIDGLSGCISVDRQSEILFQLPVVALACKLELLLGRPAQCPCKLEPPLLEVKLLSLWLCCVQLCCPEVLNITTYQRHIRLTLEMLYF